MLDEYHEWLCKKLKLVDSDKMYPFKLARVVDGKELYIEFYAWNDVKKDLQRKKIFKFEGSTHEERLENAHFKAQEINRALYAGKKIATKKDEKHSQLMEAFKAAAKIRMIDSTHDIGRQTRTILSRFHEFTTSKKIEQMELHKFGRGNVYDFLDWAREERGITPRTRNNYRDMLSSVFEVMVEREWIKENPCASVKRLRTKSNQYVAYTKTQAETLEKYLIDHNKPLYDFTRLVYHGFLRPVEVTRLKLSDILFDKGVIMVYNYNSKNKEQKPVVLTKGLRRSLEDYLGNFSGIPEYYYLFSKTWEPGPDQLHRNRFSDAHSAAQKACGLYDGILNGYSWKHTGVCNAYLAGVDIISIQQQCRHHSLEQTEIYLRSLGLRIANDLKNSDW